MTRAHGRHRKRIQDDKDEQNRERHDNCQAIIGAAFALVFTLPGDMVAARRFSLRIASLTASP